MQNSARTVPGELFFMSLTLAKRVSWVESQANLDILNNNSRKGIVSSSLPFSGDFMFLVEGSFEGLA